MFSSSNNSHLLPQISPSFEASTSFLYLNGSEILLRHHHDPFSGPDHLADNTPVFQAAIELPVPREDALCYQDADRLNVDLRTSVDAFPRRKRTVKNDRHSKIFTAKGLRDRRVRLSISIARKFFDLQDILGFDKPSKTLDWLLTKSKKAINELVRTRQSHQCGVLAGSSEADENGESVGTNSKRKSLINDTNNKPAKDPQQDEALLIAKDSRARARARARERTRERMCSKRLNIQAEHVADDYSPSIPCQSRLSSIPGFQQNLIVASDLIPNCSASAPNYAAEIWDISSIIRQSSLCAILDQHNITESHPWEVCEYLCRD